MSLAPRGALLYPRCSREELGGMEECSWIQCLTQRRKTKGTVAWQKTSGRAQAYETVRWGIRVTW